MRALLQRVDDSLNPVFVKEIYQGVRSRDFLAVWAVLLIGLLAYAVAVVNPDSRIVGHRALALVLYLICGLYALIVVPQAIGNRLRSDIASGTLDIIVLTRITPWSLVSGRLQTAFLRILLVAAYASPLIVAVVLLGGLTWSVVLATLGALLLGSVCQCALVLMFNSLVALHPRVANFARLAQAALLFAAVPFALNILGGAAIGSRLAAWSSSYWYAGTVLWLTATAAAMVAFCSSVAADVLTPEGVRTFRRSKLTFAPFYFLLCTPFFAVRLLLSSGGYGASASVIAAAWAFPTLPVALLFVFATLVGAHRPATPSASSTRRGGGFASTALYLAVLVFAASASAAAVQGQAEALRIGLRWTSFFVLCGGIACWVRGSGPPYSYFFAFVAVVAIGALAASLTEAFLGGLAEPVRIFLPPLTSRPVDPSWNTLPLALGLFALWRAQ